MLLSRRHLALPTRDLVPIPIGKPPYKLIRTPVEVRVHKTPPRTTYTVVIGNEMYRHFDDADVPDEIKGGIAMVHAFPEAERKVGITSSWAQKYTPPIPQLTEIGWQLEDGLYILLLPREFLERIYING